MSNRKYAAAVLEGAVKTEEQRMDAIVKILTDDVNDVISNIQDGPEAFSSSVISKVLKTKAIDKFKELAPELVERYELILHSEQGFMEPGWKIRISYNKKPRWGIHTTDWADAVDYSSYVTFPNYLQNHIDTFVTDQFVGRPVNTDTLEELRQSMISAVGVPEDLIAGRHYNWSMGNGDQVQFDNMTYNGDGTATVNVSVRPTQPLEYFTVDLNINND